RCERREPRRPVQLRRTEQDESAEPPAESCAHAAAKSAGRIERRFLARIDSIEDSERRQEYVQRSGFSVQRDQLREYRGHSDVWHPATGDPGFRGSRRYHVRAAPAVRQYISIQRRRDMDEVRP